LPASWLQNNFNTIQTRNTFENRNVARYNLTDIHKNIFRLKSAVKEEYAASTGKKQYSYEKKSVIGPNFHARW